MADTPNDITSDLRTSKPTIAEMLERFVSGHASVEILQTDEPLLCIPEGVQIRTLRDVRYPGLKSEDRIGTTIQTSDVRSLMGFLGNFADAQTVLTTSLDRKHYEAIVNFTTSGQKTGESLTLGWADMRLKMDLVLTERWALLKAQGKSRPARHLASWVRALVDTFEFSVDGDETDEILSLADYMESADSYAQEANLPFIGEGELLAALRQDGFDDLPAKFLITSIMEVYQSAPVEELILQFERTKGAQYTVSALHPDAVEAKVLRTTYDMILRKIPTNLQVMRNATITTDF